MLERAPNKIGELVTAVKRGDELAFESLVKRHERKIFDAGVSLHARSGGRRRRCPGNLPESIFPFRPVQRDYFFKGTSSFSTWATRIAINEAPMLLRRRRALSEVPIDYSSIDEGTTPALELADANPDPEVSCLQREEARILSAAMRKLSPGARRAIELRDLAELSIRETAGRMGISAGAVKARVFHARRKLNETLRRCMRSRRMCASDILAIAGTGNRNEAICLTCNT